VALEATFSSDMNPASIDATTFVLNQGAAAIPGS